MRILFASLPADGHFNPLTGIAVHLAAVGHDVRWYAGPEYAPRVTRLGIPVFPYAEATEVTAGNLNLLYPERARLRGPRLMSFDGEKLFVANVGAHFRDIVAIREQFPFDLFFCDGALYAEHLVATVLKVPVFATAMSAVMATGDNPPPFFGLRPARSVAARVREKALGRLFVIANKRAITAYNATLKIHGLPPVPPDHFPAGPMGSATRVFLNGTPCLEFPGYRPPPNAEFVGELAPARPSFPAGELPARVRLTTSRVVVVSQGTVDNTDPDKLIVPTIEALKDEPYVVVATTGGVGTQVLRGRYADHPNVVVEDFIDYRTLLPRADVFVTSGGWGSTVAAIGAGVPLVGAGTREGKNDLNVRVAYKGLGVDLRSEHPTPAAIRAAVGRVNKDRAIRTNLELARAELAAYDPTGIIERAVATLAVPAP